MPDQSGVDAGSATQIDLAKGARKPTKFFGRLFMLALGMLFVGFFFGRGSKAGQSGQSVVATVKDALKGVNPARGSSSK